jgi:RHS repeat-associated protein
MLMPGRKYPAAGGLYRYGFNGKEKDKETTGTSTYDYGFRIYNPALGRFLSVDPLIQKYPWYTPYQFAGNKPIKYVDLDGLEEIVVAINGNPNGTDKPGSAKLSIIIDYEVVTQGAGAIGNHGSSINPTEVQNNYSKGNTTLRMLSLPTPSLPATFLTDEQEKIALKAEAGDKKALSKLQAQNIQYYKVDIEYNVSISNTPNKNLESIMAKVDANPHRIGVVMDPITDGDQSWGGNGNYFNATINDLKVHANKKFSEAANAGQPAEGYGSIFSLLSKEANVVIFNPASLSLGINNILTHEIGHNVTNLGHDANGNGNYEYNQTGLQSNQSGSIYPTKENTRTIINDASNRSTIKSAPKSGD